MQEETIRDTRRESVTAYWVLSAVLWVVGIGSVALVQTAGPGQDLTYAWMVWYFPVIALLMTGYAANESRQLRLQGTAILKPDPLPGAVGGHVGGRVLMRHRLPPSARVTCELACNDHWQVHTRYRHSYGANLVWQEWGMGLVKLIEHGTVVAFRFDVPQGLPPSGAPTSEPGTHGEHRWELELRLEDGALLNRFMVPVTNGPAKSERIPLDLTGNTAERMREVLAIAHRDTAAARWLKRHHHLVLARSAKGLQLRSLGWRDAASGLPLLALFGLFVAAGLQMLVMGPSAGDPGTALLTLAVGGWLAWKTLVRMTQTTDTLVGSGGLRVVTRAFPTLSRSRSIAVAQVERIAHEVSVAEGYQVYAWTRHGDKVLLVEGLKGEQAGMAVAELIGREGRLARGRVAP